MVPKEVVNLRESSANLFILNVSGNNNSKSPCTKISKNTTYRVVPIVCDDRKKKNKNATCLTIIRGEGTSRLQSLFSLVF